ncbi:MAG: hypothetical protein ACOC80_09470, partial [Petrotogales bacterium]
LNNIIEQLKMRGIQAPEEFANYSFDEIVNWADEVENTMDTGDEVIDQVRNFANAQREMAMENNRLEENLMTANKKFNLSKLSQYEDDDLYKEDVLFPEMEEESFREMLSEEDDSLEDPYDMENIEDSEDNNQRWSTHYDLKQWLDRQEDRTVSRSYILERVPETYHQAIEDALESYYEGDLTEEEKLKIASKIFDILPEVVKETEPNPDEGILEAPYIEAQKIVKDTDQLIKNMAEKNDGSFNMKKMAQHKAVDENIIMYGPAQTRIDPFLRQPISDMHVVERNKGFGLVVDNIWNIDWEALWRGNIMDKYSRAFRDKDGRWVGGYLNKRFETDRWVPENNNYQLKPGQKRRPYLPETKSTEARLESMREKEADERGYAPASSGKPYNWSKEASSKKKI